MKEVYSFTTWHTPSRPVELHMRLLLYDGMRLDFGVCQLKWLLQGSTLKFQSFFPTCPAISRRACTGYAHQTRIYQAQSYRNQIQLRNESPPNRELLTYTIQQILDKSLKYYILFLFPRLFCAFVDTHCYYYYYFL